MSKSKRARSTKPLPASKKLFKAATRQCGIRATAKPEGRSSVWIEAHVADKLSALRGPLATHRSITGRVRL